MRIVLPNALTNADLDAAIRILTTAGIVVEAHALVQRHSEIIGSFVLVPDSQVAQALDALVFANIKVTR